MNKSELSPIEQEVQGHLDDCFPNTDYPFFIIGVSGGPDSVALLRIFKRLGLHGIVAHVNYSKRKEAADRDQQLVERLAEQWEFSFESVKVDPEKESYNNFQQWARKKRFDLYRKLLSQHEADAVALAHHDDDQLETILLKLFRGAGLASWKGMDICENDLFRPLLNITKSQILTYLEEYEIPYRVDESNLKSTYARNFLRNELIQDLEKWFPGWRENIRRLPEQARLFDKALEHLGAFVAHGSRFDRDKLLQLDKKLQKALLMHYIQTNIKDIKLSRGTIRELDKIDDLQTGQYLQLDDDFVILRDRGKFLIQEKSQERENNFRKQIYREEIENDSLRIRQFHFGIVPYQKPDFDHHLYLDVDKINWPVTVRYWKEGDRFSPLGMKRHQKISDHLTNRKVPADQKPDALVLISNQNTVISVLYNHIPPGTISENVRCEDNTETALRIKHNKLNS